MPSNPSAHYDVLILGAGGAGMMCAITAGQRGRRVLLIDHSKKIGGKILISGGGRCNFTNLGATPAQYVSENPHFCKSAMSRYTPQDFVALVEKHRIPYHEKKLGQQFCDRSAQDIVDLLVAECREAGAEFLLEAGIEALESLAAPGGAPSFEVRTSRGRFTSESVVVATGGLSIPKIGATGIGYEIARQFGHTIIPTRPALDGFVLTGEGAQSLKELSGLSVDCTIECNGKKFRENILFTHSGLSGPASLQASLHWSPGDPVVVNLLPERDFRVQLLERKRQGGNSLLKNVLAESLPARFAEAFTAEFFRKSPEFEKYTETPLSKAPDRLLEAFAERVHQWVLKPSSTVGYSKAEVTRGGVNTDELSSKTMESRKQKGLYFIGEVVDVTGWLGGYNFQWAWASGRAAGEVV